MIGRLAYAILAGVIAFIICSIIGHFANLGLFAVYAGIIGVLVAIVYFFRGPGRAGPVV